MDQAKEVFRKWYFIPKGFLRLCFILINNFYCIPTYVVWMHLLYPLYILNPKLYWKVEGYFFHWLLAMVASWSYSAGYDVVEVGDDISECINKKTLILANHQSTGDVPMLFACYNARKHVLPNIMWIMDSVFKYTNFGIVSVLHQDFFIRSGKTTRDKSLEELTHHLFEKFNPLNRNWVVLFPEGGFLKKRKAVSHRYAEKNGLPKFENVSLPRLGALNVVMNSIGPRALNNNRNCVMNCNTKPEIINDKIEWVLDITIAYPKGVPIDLSHIVFGHRPPCQTIFFYRLYRATDIPDNQEDMTKWLFDRWAEKETMLQTYYNTGSIPMTCSNRQTLQPQIVVQDYLRFILLHIFFIISTYIHVRMFVFLFKLLFLSWHN